MNVIRMIGTKHKKLLMLYGVIICLLIIGTVQSSYFLTTENLTNILNQAIPLAMVALGQTVVLLAGGIDLSVGAMVSISTVLAATMVNFSTGSAVLYLLTILTIAVLLGLLNGLVVTKLRIHPMIATICTGLIGSGIALLIMSSPGGYVPYSSVKFLAASFGAFRLPMLYFILISLGLYFYLRHIRSGRYIYAVGGNPKSAEAAGINVGRITILAYILGSLLAALGGIFLVCRIYSGDPTIGNPFTLDSVIVVLIGGTSFLGGIGGIGGTIAGALLLALVANLLNLLHIQPFYHYIIRGLLFVGAVMTYNIQWRRK